FVGVAVGAQGRTFQGDSGKQSFVAGVGKDFGAHHNVGGAFGRAPFRTSGRRGVRAQLHLAGEQRAGTLGIHDQQHEIGGLAAELEADADAFQGIEGGRSPFAGIVFATAADHHATTVTAANAKSSLFHGGKNNHALGLVEQVLGNVVRDV